MLIKLFSSIILQIFILFLFKTKNCLAIDVELKSTKITKTLVNLIIYLIIKWKI